VFSHVIDPGRVQGHYHQSKKICPFPAVPSLARALSQAESLNHHPRFPVSRSPAPHNLPSFALHLAVANVEPAPKGVVDRCLESICSSRLSLIFFKRSFSSSRGRFAGGSGPSLPLVNFIAN